jgi:hypothetical protein
MAGYHIQSPLRPRSAIALDPLNCEPMIMKLVQASQILNIISRGGARVA